MKWNACLIVTLIATGMVIYILNLFEPITSLIFSGLAVFVLIYGYLLYVDYSLLVMKKHQFITYFYGLFLLIMALSFPFLADVPFIHVLQYLLWFLIGIITIVISIYSYMNLEKMHKDADAARSNHFIHVIADEVEKRTSPDKSWEIHASDFFEEKFGRYFGKRV